MPAVLLKRPTEVPRRRRARGLACALVVGLAALTLSSAAQAAVTLSCIHADSTKGRLSVVYATGSVGGQEVKQFDADVEVSPGSYKARQTVVFKVKGVTVGKRRLVRDNNGDLEADLKLLSTKTKGKKAWPAKFPPVSTGTTVTVRIAGKNALSCTF
jgi:hypothetical protein